MFVFGEVSGRFPDVYRGGRPGEVYIDSWFSDWTYKVSFSADTGRSFRHVYVSDVLPPDDFSYIRFMSDREPGVFYIIRRSIVENFDPWGDHSVICIDYYRDYGETLVDTYCHDLTKDYVTDIGEMEMKDDVVVYPNPTKGEVFVGMPFMASLQNVEIFDLMGRKVFEQKAESRKQNGEWRMDISNIPSGMYFLRITTDNGIINKKIIKY